SGRRGASWLVGSSCPLLPVDSDSLGPRLERLLMSFSRIQSRIVRFVTHAQPWSQTSGAFAPDSVHRRWRPDLDFIPGERVGGDRPIGCQPPRPPSMYRIGKECVWSLFSCKNGVHLPPTCQSDK